MTTTKERPIPMIAPMVRALLDGRKTQTRRVLKAPTSVTGFRHWLANEWDSMQGDQRVASVRCRYGQPGDRLWVRETFARIDGQTQPWIATDYRATYKHGDRLGDSLGIKKRWTPSIHMPRHASRITLEVTSVRVERLQEINELDALYEGVEPAATPTGFGGYVNAYSRLWDELNGPGAWHTNPWVWVVGFRRLLEEAKPCQ